MTTFIAYHCGAANSQISEPPRIRHDETRTRNVPTGSFRFDDRWGGSIRASSFTTHPPDERKVKVKSYLFENPDGSPKDVSAHRRCVKKIVWAFARHKLEYLDQCGDDNDNRRPELQTTPVILEWDIALLLVISTLLPCF